MALDVQSVMSAGGGDHLTITAAEAATDNDLSVTHYRLEIHHDSGGDTTVYDEAVTFSGSTNVTATEFRIFTAFAGDQYNIQNDTGVVVDHDPSGATIFALAENFVEIQGLKFSGTRSESIIVGIDLQAANNTVSRCFAHITATSTGAVAAFVSGDPSTNGSFKSCVTKGTGHTGSGDSDGFFSFDSICEFLNCTAYDHDHNGFIGTSEDFISTNCVGIDNGTDFDAANMDAASDYNCSSDTTASVGTNSITEKDRDDTFEDAVNDDFRLKVGADAEAGIDDSTDNPLDFDGNPWGDTAFMGSYATQLSAGNIAPILEVIHKQQYSQRVRM